MILTGILRHYLSTLLQSTPKRQLLAKIREQRSLGRAQNLRNNYQQVSKAAFERRKEAFLDGRAKNAQVGIRALFGAVCRAIETLYQCGCHGRRG